MHADPGNEKFTLLHILLVLSEQNTYNARRSGKRKTHVTLQNFQKYEINQKSEKHFLHIMYLDGLANFGDFCGRPTLVQKFSRQKSIFGDFSKMQF